MADKTIKINESISIIIHDNLDSIDSFLGVADIIKTIKRTVDNVDNKVSPLRQGNKRTWGFLTDEKIKELVEYRKKGGNIRKLAIKWGSSENLLYNKISTLKKDGVIK